MSLVCCWLSLPILKFSPLLKNQHCWIPILSGMVKINQLTHVLPLNHYLLYLKFIYIYQTETLSAIVQFHPLMEVGTDLCQFCPLNSNIQLNVWNVADFDFFSTAVRGQWGSYFLKDNFPCKYVILHIIHITAQSLKKTSPHVKLAYGPFTILSCGYVMTFCYSTWHFTSLMKFELCGGNIHFCLKFWSES